MFEKWANLPHRLDEMDVLVKPEQESMPQEEGNGGQSGSEDGSVAEYVATVPKNNASSLSLGPLSILI